MGKNSKVSLDKWNEERRKRRADLKKHPEDNELRELLSAARKMSSIEDLCNKLDKSPAKVKEIVERAKNAGVDLQIGNQHISLTPKEQIRTVIDTRILPTKTEKQYVGVISDLHLGSKYCMREQLIDCVNSFYKRGIREILIPGDLLDGCYKHGAFELSHVGIEDQSQDLFETLPMLKGLTYHAITGNHDETFTDLTGVNVGNYIIGYFRDRGRNDIRFYGRCRAFIQMHGVVIEMWHPLQKMGYALSYPIQNHIKDYAPGEKPHIALIGHWHKFVFLNFRATYGIACPTFQASGSAFSKRLGGHPVIGGLILSWEIAGEDLIRSFSVEHREYFEVETPRRIEL